MCPRSGFRSGGTCERTLVPVFVPGEHPNVPSFRFSLRGNILQNHPFGNHPFGNPRTWPNLTLSQTSERKVPQRKINPQKFRFSVSEMVCSIPMETPVRVPTRICQVLRKVHTKRLWWWFTWYVSCSSTKLFCITLLTGLVTYFVRTST